MQNVVCKWKYSFMLSVLSLANNVSLPILPNNPKTNTILVSNMNEEIKTEKRKKICVLIPLYKFVPIQSHEAFMKFACEARNYFDAIIRSSNCSWVHVARNYLLNEFIKHDKTENFDYVMWIDQDMVFEPIQVKELIEKLEEKNWDAVSAVAYNVGDDREIFPMLLRKNPDGRINSLTNEEAESGQDIEIHSAGFGFLLMKAEVLRKMREKKGYDVFWYARNEHNQMLGEDVLFFEEASQMGFKLGMAGKVVVGHMKEVRI
jgi:hypothetical protein